MFDWVNQRGLASAVWNLDQNVSKNCVFNFKPVVHLKNSILFMSAKNIQFRPMKCSISRIWIKLSQKLILHNNRSFLMSFCVFHPTNWDKVIKIIRNKIFLVPAHLTKTCIFFTGLSIFSKIKSNLNILCTYLLETIMHIVWAIIQKFISNSGSFLALDGPDLNKTHRFCLSRYIMLFSWTWDVHKFWGKRNNLLLFLWIH